MKAFVLRWGPALIMMLVIFTFSSIPSAEMPNFGLADTLIKKLGHATEYGILFLTLARALRPASWQGLAACWLLVILYAASDEFHQSFVAGRNSTVVDVGIDGLGGLVASFALACLKFLGRLVGLKKD
jgi:VanZ family protein